MGNTKIPDANKQYIPCPFCGEDILPIAKKCKHCGEFLDTPEAKKAADDPDPSGPGQESALYESHPAMFRSSPLGFILSAALCLVGVGLIILLVWKLKSLSTLLTVTSKKTVLRRGLLSKNTNEVFHKDVRNVQVHQTFWQRLFDVGTVGISSAGQSGLEIEVAGLPRPSEVSALINKHRETGV